MYSNEDLIIKLQNLARELDRTPTKEEWRDATSVADKTLCHHFNCGGERGVPYDIDVNDKNEYWINFLVMAGLPPYDYTRESLLSTARRMVRKTKDGLIDPNKDWFLPHMAVYKFFKTWENFMAQVSIYRLDSEMETGDLSGKSLEDIAFELKLLEDRLTELFPEAKVTISISF